MGAAPQVDNKGRPLADRTDAGRKKAKEIDDWFMGQKDYAKSGVLSQVLGYDRMREAAIKKQFGETDYNTWNAFRDAPPDVAAPDATATLMKAGPNAGLGLGKRLLRGRAQSFVSGPTASAKTYLGS